MAAELDTKVTEFRERPLDAGPYRYLWIDALTQKVREGGRVVNVSPCTETRLDLPNVREGVCKGVSECFLLAFLQAGAA